MDHQTAFRLFALARCLVPDPDAAADLFMQATSEEDLRARVARWRRQQGLPTTPDTSPPAPQPLSRAEEELALHLARRGQKRRLTLKLLAAAGAALLLLTAALAARALPAIQGRDLAHNPIFTGAPLKEAEVPGGLTFAIHGVEAVPGVTTLWWELTGPGAAAHAETWAAGLRLGRDRTAPERSETKAYQKNRVLGKAEFPFLIPDESALLVVEQPGGPPLAILGVLVNHRPDDPAARRYPVQQAVKAAGSSVTVAEVLISPTATNVVLRGDPWFPRLLAEDVPLEPVGIWPQALRRPDEYQVVLPPVPPGTRRLVLSFPPADDWVWQPLVLNLPAPERFASWELDGNRLTATLTADSGTVFHTTAHFVDARGEQFLALLSPDPAAQNRWRLEAELVQYWQIRQGTETILAEVRASELRQLHLAVLTPVPTPTILIDLHP